MTMNTRANRLHPRPMEKKNDGTRPRARQSEKFSNEHPKGTQTHMLLSSSPLPRTLCTLSGAILPRRFHSPPLPFRYSSSTVVPLVLATSARFARESRPCFPLHRRPVRLSSDERARPVSFAVFSDGCLWVTETSRGRAGINTGRFFSCPARRAVGSSRAWSRSFESALFEWRKEMLRREIRNGKIYEYSSLL